MNKKAIFPLIGIFFLIILAFLVIKFVPFNKFLSISPELDNRLNYFDKKTDATNFVSTSPPDCYLRGEACFSENNLFIVNSASTALLTFIAEDYIQFSGYGANYRSHIWFKKDFTGLNVFLKYKSDGDVNYFQINSIDMPVFERTYGVLEVKPDNLNIGIYDIFVNGEFYKKIDIGNNKLDFVFYISASQNANLVIDYIKYVPVESFTIKNDEVWVQEVRGSDYSYSNLNWEMIGYQSQIRPATIRDLTQQTEVPAPQIYINLINGKSVIVQPNTIHTFYYRTKWVEGLDSSCKGQLDKVERKVGDRWVCDSYVKETPIIQQCQIKSDCAILPDCETQKELISCNNNLCDYSQFSPACKNQLITYQEKVTEIENTKFVPIISGGNSFYCFFDETKSSCNVGEKTISITAPENTCSVSGSDIVSNSDCFRTTVFFNGKPYLSKNNQEINADYNIKITPAIGATYTEQGLRKGWGIVTKVTLPDNFLDITPKTLGNKFILQNSNDKVSFIINNKLGFGIDGGYTLQTQNLALEGGVVLQNIDVPLYLKSGENIVTYNFKTSQLGTIVDAISVFGKVKTDKEYILKSSDDGKEKLLIISKEIVTKLPQEIEKVQPETITSPIIGIEKPSIVKRFFNAILAFFKSLF